MISPLQNLLAEKEAVQRFLDQTPQDAVLERNSWLARLDTIEEEIEAEKSRRKPARSLVTYKGPPVVGSYGIASAFGLAATRAYTNFVQQIAAQTQRVGALGSRGRALRSRVNDLLIVGPAYGSFGFELEEQLSEQLTIDGKTDLANALDKTQALLQSTLQSDEELANELAGVDPRAITALRNFLEILVKNDSVCAVDADGFYFQFNSPEEVERSLIRLEEANIRSERVELTGAFRGLLPTPRTFEFQRDDIGEIIRGKIDPAVSQITTINQNLGRRAQLSLVSFQVGNGRPRYLLVREPQWL